MIYELVLTLIIVAISVKPKNFFQFVRFIDHQVTSKSFMKAAVLDQKNGRLYQSFYKYTINILTANISQIASP